ncbi:PEPxxWA-CTERM sorting domain-containing protein [Sphingosinicellaceae bacterium]|nr:PEPxxWA-CTERM sorting domain-containing protein [Sphingosinicellaceae bacterium]
MIKSLVVVASLALAASPLAAVTVTNAAPITVPDPGETTSTINVAGLGNITGLTVTLNGLTHSYPDDLVFGVLNESLGLGFVFLSGAGGSDNIDGVTLTFGDAASSVLPKSYVGGAIVSGTFLPSNFSGFAFTYFHNAGSFAAFNGFSANGAWTLYVDDISSSDGGSIAGGWSLNFTTVAGAVPEPATWALMLGGFGLVGGAMRRRGTQPRGAA